MEFKSVSSIGIHWNCIGIHWNCIGIHWKPLEVRWEKHRAWMNECDIGNDGNPVEEEAGQNVADETEGNSKKAKLKAKAKGKGKRLQNNTQNTQKKVQSKLAVLMNDAKKMKLSYGTTISQATTVMSSLQNDESWRVLAGLPECQELKDQQGQISETMKSNNGFGEKVIQQELQKVKKNMDGAEFETQLKRFLEAITPLLQGIAASTKVLVDQKAARDNARKSKA